MPSDPPPRRSEDDLDFGPTLRGLREGMRVFDRYTLQRMLGRGGMGIVWLAQDAKLDLPMALKFLPENLAHDESALADLREETQRCMRLGHTNIVRVHDLVDDSSTAAIVMEYVDGRTLSALRLERPEKVFEPEDLTPWLLQVCEALEYAHTEARLVHRDLKPSNLMLTSHGQIKVMDFGIASSLGDSMSRVSRAGTKSVAGGTLPYMSPQQLLGYPASVTDDVYSLGATLFELLTGKPPFYTGSLERQIESVPPPSVAERRAQLGVQGAGEQPVPELWETVLAACLEKEAHKRPASPMALWRALNGEPLELAGERVSGKRAPKPGGVPAKRPSPVAASAAPRTGFRPVMIGLSVIGIAAVCAAAWWVGVEQPRRQAALQAERESKEAAEAGKSAAELEAARLAREKADAEAAAAASAAQALRAEKEKQELLAQKAREETRRMELEKQSAEAALLAAQKQAEQQRMQDDLQRSLEAKQRADAERQRMQAAADQQARKSSLEDFVKSHLRSYDSDSASDFASHFADYSDYMYHDNGRAPRSFVVTDRAKYIRDYPVRRYEILNNNTFNYKFQGDDTATVTYSYSYEVRGAKFRSGRSSVTLTVERVNGSWKITSFHERVLKN